MPELFSSTDRFVFALRFELEGEEFRSQLVWIAVPPYSATMSDESISWMNARAGDRMICSGERETIRAITLYSVFPSAWNGHEVISGANWLQGA